MKQHLFVLLIFTEVLTSVQPDPRRYRLIKQGKTWNDAQAYCRATYTDLATISSNEDMVQLQNEALKQQFNSSAWIGLYTNFNSWHWSFGNEVLGSFKSWYYSQPDNEKGNEQCVGVNNDAWCDILCNWTIPFVCFDETKTGNDTYILISQAMSWHDAQSYCRQHYTDLASARNATENSVVGGLNYMAYTWIGLNRDPWKWSDQTTNVSFITWSPGTAKDYLQNKSCGCLSNGIASVAQCPTIMPFYCYTFQYQQQQIIRVKVKSSQNVNDPAIMAAILEKIQQKLKDGGTGNIILKWRELDDGVVFYKEKENHNNAAL